MPDVRPINEKKYEISKHRFLELYHHCLQYQEWRTELNSMKDTVRGIANTEGARGRAEGSATEWLALRRLKLQKKCEIIEQTAIDADPSLYLYILEGVTTEYASYKYLKQVKDIPCGKDMYYDRRRRFFWLLSQKI